MPPLRRVLGLCAGALTIWFVACAKDEGVDAVPPKKDGGGGTGAKDGGGGVGNSDSGWPIGGFGGPCKKDIDCTKGICVDIGQSKPNLVCTQPCQTGKSCPPNGYCAWDPDYGYLCIPDIGNQCSQCTADSDCPNVGDICAVSPKYDRFCARDCSFDQACPSGMTCTDAGSYPPGSDAGAPGPGAGEAGTPTKPLKMCVPSNNDSCPCDTKRDGAKRTCKQTVGTKTCEGTETCNAQTQKWENCTASAPTAEACDGADNDCNGIPDDGDPAVMCGSLGTPPHANWACINGGCTIGACDAGWANYPPGSPTAGCPCQIDSGEPDETCSAAHAAGSVNDNSTTALTINGTLSADADVDWWKFDTVDSDEGSTNSYHIKIVFSAPATNNEFVFDVLRGACATPDTKHSALTSYDWCVDGVGSNKTGEKVCGPTAVVHCGPHSKPYFVRVRRKSGATPTCTQYTLSVTAKGGGTCDFTQSCDPQVNEVP